MKNSKEYHLKWLKKRGLDSKTLKEKLKNKNSEWYTEKIYSRSEGTIPSNGTKPVYTKKSNNFTISIPYNKGPYMVCSKEDIKYIGKK